MLEENQSFETFLECVEEPILIFDETLEKFRTNTIMEQGVANLQFYDEAGKFKVNLLKQLKNLIKGYEGDFPLEGNTEFVDSSMVMLPWAIKKLSLGQNFFYICCPKIFKFLDEKLKKSHQESLDQSFALEQSAIVATTDIKGKITYVNDLFCKVSKYSAGELIGQTHGIVNSQTHTKEFFMDLWKTISGGKVWRGEICNRAKDGELYWVDTTIVPFLNSEGNPIRYVSIRYDVTDRILAQKNLTQQRMRTSHAEKMASLGEMAAGIAHELGNPLASIRAWAEVVSNQISRGQMELDEISKTFSSVTNKIDRMSRILKGMLTYARDGSRDPKGNVQLATLISNVLEYCSYKISKSGVTLNCDPIPAYLQVIGRETELSQVLVNLLLNSCDALKEIEKPAIKIQVLDQKEKVIISIIDNGHGIKKEIVDQLFKPFFTTKEQGKGTGLGLSIANNIIANHGGTLSFDSTSLLTKFDIILPTGK